MTNNYERIFKFDSLAANIHQDMTMYCFSIDEVSALRGISVAEARKKFSIAKYIIKNPKEAWLYGLSLRSRKAILKFTPYKSKNELRNDIISGNIDLESLPNIGHKTAFEVLRWCAIDR